MIIPLKRKYRSFKPVKRTKHGVDVSGKSQKNKKSSGNKKSYEYGSRVMVLDERGKVRMVDGNPADYRRGLGK